MNSKLILIWQKLLSYVTSEDEMPTHSQMLWNDARKTSKPTTIASAIKLNRWFTGNHQVQVLTQLLATINLQASSSQDSSSCSIPFNSVEVVSTFAERRLKQFLLRKSTYLASKGERINSLGILAIIAPITLIFLFKRGEDGKANISLEILINSNYLH